jgi:hypothetical protein
MTYTSDTHALSCDVTFHPATPEGPGVDPEDALMTRPYVKIGDVLVFVYADRDEADEDGPLRLRVSIDLDDVGGEDPVPIEVTCQGETVWSADGPGSIVNAPEEDAGDESEPNLDVAFAETPEGRALLARAVDIIENEADLVRDDDSGGRSAEVKRLVRALPDGPTRHRLIDTFGAEADEVFGETAEDRASFGDPVRYAFERMPASEYREASR